VSTGSRNGSAAATLVSVSGTLVCGVVDSDGGLAAARLGAALATRLELRLVLAHVVREESQLTAGERTLARIAAMVGDAETRVAVGSRIDALVRIASEEGADAIVVGSRPRGARNAQLRSSLAHDLEAATSVPVVIAPPVTRARSGRRLTLAAAPQRR
jgi:nucleotide-binding universal stress UspA family protein